LEQNSLGQMSIGTFGTNNKILEHEIESQDMDIIDWTFSPQNNNVTTNVYLKHKTTIVLYQSQLYESRLEALISIFNLLKLQQII